MPAAVIIPARYQSTRFPGKALAPLNGIPIIQHVWERARAASRVEEVIIATDDERIMEAVAAFGGRAVMTDPAHASGTDRIAEAAAGLSQDIIVNVQGDEPLIRPEVIDAAVALVADDPRTDIGTVASPIPDDAEAVNPNVVKAVVGAEGFALYFSRSPVPYHRDLWASPAGANVSGGARLLKHIGIYSYRREALTRFASLEPSPLEETEKLEQLRALENGMRIKVAVMHYESLGVDTPEDLEKIKTIVEQNLR